VFDLKSSPFATQILGHEPAMAKVRFVLAAKQTSFLNDFYGHMAFDLPLLHQG